MNRYIHLLGLCFWALIAVSCQDDDNSELKNESGLLISLANDVEVTTKSTPAELGEPLKAKFKIKVVNDAAPTLKYYDGNYKDGLRVSAPAGTYRLTADYGTNPALALDDPYYRGETTAEVVEGVSTPASIPCKVANALTSVVFGEQPEEGQDFTADFSDYRVEVYVEEDGNHNYVAPVEIKNNGTSAYYRAGTIPTYTFIGTVKETGKEYKQVLSHAKLRSPENFEAGKHCIITLTMAKPVTGLKVDIEKVEIEQVSINETIPLEWLPKPKVEATDAFENNVLSIVETETVKDAVVKLNTAMALQDLKLKFNFADEQFAGLNGEYLLSKAEDKKTIEAALGITLPNIGETGQVIDFTNVVNRLLTNNGAPTDNTVELDVQSNNRWSSEDTEANRVFTLRCDKPEFAVSVYPGNIWTKEFTMNPLNKTQVSTGNYDVISKDLKYQFSDNNQDWTEFGEDLRKDQLTPGQTYYVRALYRNAVASEVKEVKTYPLIALENGNLSSYSVVKGEDGNRWNGYGSLFQWVSWATLNELTVDHCVVTSYSYNSRSGTRPIGDVRGGASDNTAVWIITIGYGYGGTNGSPKSVSPGELFLGTYNTKGIDFASHPTGVNFYYKYAPFKGDKSDIYVQVLHDDVVLGSGNLQETATVSNYVDYTININYDNADLSLTPNKIILVFKSGFNSEVESRESGGLTSSNTANPKFRGSELYIDDISLIYDK